MNALDELARSVDALERVDKAPFQRRARILQSLWRVEHSYPVGRHRGRPMGSLLEMPWAEGSLANFLTDEIRQVVREEVMDPEASQGQLYGKPRIFNNLLSSQSLAFNLFAPLSRDLALATEVFGKLTSGRCGDVTAVAFEHSPGRGDDRYTSDRSAFDVYVTFTCPQGGRGFLGVEVKYHEGLRGKTPRHHARYDEVAAQMGCFDPGASERLRRRPLQQIWRDHLLAGSHLAADGFQDGLFVFLNPEGNDVCNEAVAAYRQCLSRTDTFEHWTMESVVETVRSFTDSEWIRAFYDRYLDFARVHARAGG